ncbi:mechanosensitive ion channel domain-containing protein [Labrenzia sp. OB1]|uniref:mechanosensitive ion channel family protein n=1 Tax=Labrenzia sp. OB1 TaxID=1561204 RepID=UPI0007B1F2EA|nr:mechanosensitive ion channel domain-containing protein [Labrenzia sp. OB1]KZM47686.1 mechanosensitive ion channel protein [Labrenzia sp. OB1]
MTALMLLGLAVGAAHAQENQELPVAEAGGTSQSLFERAVRAIEEKTVSVQALELLRGQLAEVRDANAAIVRRDDLAADLLSAQLESLGPAPAEGAGEAADVAARRLELENALAKANAPIRQAGETLRHVEVLIRELDKQLRLRKLQEVVERYPTPLVVSTWQNGLEEVSEFRQRLWRDIQSELARPSVSKQLNRTVPIALGLALFGLGFLVFLQFPLSRGLMRHAERRRGGVRGLLLALASNSTFILLPVIGAVALVAILPILDIRPNAVRTAVSALPVLAIVMIIAHWLGHTIFAPEAQRWRMLDLSDAEALRGLRLCQALGVFLMLELLLETLEIDQAFGPAAISVLSAPLIFLAAGLLWLLAGTLRKNEAATEPSELREDGEPDETDVHLKDSGFLLFLSLLMRGAALLAVGVVLAGYVKLARVASIPMIVTVAQLGLGYLLYHLARQIFNAVTDKEDTAPVPISLSISLVCGLTLVFAPLIAMTWGARPTDIVEVGRLLYNGVQFGDIRLSLDSFIILIAVFGLGMLVTRWLQNLLRRSVLPQTRMDAGARNAVLTGVSYVGLTLAVLIAVSTAGLNLSSLAVVAGALSVGIGFGLQTIVSNFVSGIILLIERPIKEGDWIEVSGQSGYVRKISVRSTRIETFDRHDVIIPNSDLIAGTVKNMTLSSKTGRLILPVGVAYGSDLEKVKSILLDAARGHTSITRYPMPSVLFTGLGDSSLDFELRCYLKDVGTILTTRSDLYFTVYNELGKAGIEIPFPQRDLHLRDIDRLADAIERRSEARDPD